jgi:non-specific serine/threonine protein kinase/serine/threonine-protein kinase
MIDREQLVDELFAQAVELPAADREKLFSERAAQNTAATSDGVLDEVKALLTDYRRAEAKEFLHEPLVSNESTHALADGQDFQGYRILRLIAEGGMGQVYLAEDRELDRKVAIKLTNSHLKSRDILRRFKNERRILANLQHSNIAQLYETGATKDGLPYFVMEYVEGIPIDRFAGDHRLTIHERLKLFRTVCSAISYAHQNLVVHRDIKPGNILVTQNGEPKLLDFGIAKLLQEDGEETLDATVTLFRAMTPQYASPEQVRGAPVTTSSDVYSLGVLLYELLTRSRPYNVTRRTPNEIAKAICEQVPPKPSLVVSGQWSVISKSETPASIGESSHPRRNSPADMKALRGDLDNIILKALSKEPERRYLSVEQFSEDIRRHLEGLPVTARKDTFSYRASKFVQRNKIAVAAGAVILLTLVGGIIATGWEARTARLERARSERRFNDVRKVANSFMFEFHDSIKDLPGALASRQLVITRALEYLDSLASEAGNDRSLQNELATAYQKIGEIAFDTGQMVETRRKATIICEELVRAEPHNETYLKQLSDNYQQMSDAMKIIGHTTAALEYARKSLHCIETLVAGHPERLDSQALLADSCFSLAMAQAEAGDFQAAIGTDQRAINLQENVVRGEPDNKEAFRDLAIMYGQISRMLEKNGRYSEAITYGRKDQEMVWVLLNSNPASARYRRDDWGNYLRNGRLLAKTGDRSEADQYLTKALDYIRQFSEADPGDKGHRLWLAVTLYTFGEVLADSDKTQDALKDYSRGVTIMEELLAADSSWLEARKYLAEMYVSLGRLLGKIHKTDNAREYLAKAIQLAEQAASSDPENAQARRDEAEAFLAMADLCASEGKRKRFDEWQEARSWYQKSLNIYEDMKTHGTLSGADAGKPDQLGKEIAKCDAALATS